MWLRTTLSRALLRPLRVLTAAGTVPTDTFSPEYLYLVQQSKRLSLVRTLNQIPLRKPLKWPLFISIVLIKWADLTLSNSLIRSLINEYDLLQRVNPRDQEEPH